MKCLKQVLTLVIFAAALCSSVGLHAWAYYGAVVRDPKTGHIVRLLGDRHANNMHEESEREFMKHITPSLDYYLKTKAPEIFLVELGKNVGDVQKKIITFLNAGNEPQNTERLPLIGRLIFVVLKNKSTFNKIMFNDSYGFCETPNISLIGFDLRSQQQYKLLNIIQQLYIYSKMYEEIKYSPQDKKSLSVLFREEIKNFKHAYKLFMETVTKQFDRVSKYSYGKVFDKAFDRYFHDIFGNGQNSWFDDLGHVLGIDFELDSDVREKNEIAQETVLKFLLRPIAEMGFLSCIGRAHYQKRNITLYTGAAHSKNLLEDLKNLGYEVLFFKEKAMDTCLSKEDCESFFSIKPLPKSKL